MHKKQTKCFFQKVVFLAFFTVFLIFMLLPASFSFARQTIKKSRDITAPAAQRDPTTTTTTRELTTTTIGRETTTTTTTRELSTTTSVPDTTTTIVFDTSTTTSVATLPTTTTTASRDTSTTTTAVLDTTTTTTAAVAAATDCQSAKDNAQIICCTDAVSAPVPDNLDYVSLTNCETGEVESFACVHDPATGSELATETTVTEGAAEDYSSPECQAALDDVADYCAEQDENWHEDHTYTLECESVKTAVYPLCDDLQMISEIGCPEWPGLEVLQRIFEGTTEGPPIQIPIPTPEETPFEELESDAAAKPGADMDQFTQLMDNETALKEKEDQKLRIEIPGNFIRYMMARTFFKKALEMMDGQDGFECEPDELECSIDPLELADLSPFLTIDKENFKLSAKKASYGYRLYDLWAGEEDSVYIQWSGEIRVETSSKMKLDLKDNATLAVIPLHEPDAANGYSTDVEVSERWLDRAQLVLELPDDRCSPLQGNQYNDKYITWTTPFSCNCTGNDAGKTNYCVVDPYEREESEINIDDLESAGADLVEVVCTDPLTTAEGENLSEYLSNQGYSDEFVAQVITTLRDFGCAGRTVTRVATEEGLITSAIGLEFTNIMDLGALQATMEPGIFTIKFPFFGTAIQYLEKTWWGWLFSWIIEIIQKLLEAIISAKGTLLLNVLVNTASASLGDQEMLLHGVISHSLGTDDSDPDISIGLRRLATDAPEVKITNFGFSWETPSCDSMDGPEDLLNLITCPFEILVNLLKYVLSPITNLLLTLADHMFDLMNFINDEISGVVINEVAKIEDSNQIAALIKGTVVSTSTNPYYLAEEYADQEQLGQLLGVVTDSLPVLQDLAKTIPPPLVQLCLLAGNSDTAGGVACQIVKIFAGGFDVDSGSKGVNEVRVDIPRLGAKTHYRSMADFEELSSMLNDDLPPVRFCLPGDNPPGSEVYDQDDLLILTDFNEIDISDEESAKPHDWRTQSALFLDLKAHGQLSIPGLASLLIKPTERTNLLINEVFVCKDNEYCNPAKNYIRDRAELALCSMASDIWYSLAFSEEEQQYYNLAADMEPELIATLMVFAEPVEGDLPDDFSEDLEAVAEWLSQCQEALSELEWALPGPSICEDLAGSSAKTLSALYQFRDTVLSTDEKGIFYRTAYYRLRTDLVALFDAHPHLLNRTATFINRVAPRLQTAGPQEIIVLSAGDLAECRSLLHDMIKVSNGPLKQTLTRLRTDLETGTLLPALGIRVE